MAEYLYTLTRSSKRGSYPILCGGSREDAELAFHRYLCRARGLQQLDAAEAEGAPKTVPVQYGYIEIVAVPVGGAL